MCLLKHNTLCAHNNAHSFQLLSVAALRRRRRAAARLRMAQHIAQRSVSSRRRQRRRTCVACRCTLRHQLLGYAMFYASATQLRSIFWFSNFTNVKISGNQIKRLLHKIMFTYQRYAPRHYLVFTYPAYTYIQLYKAPIHI